jgi:signal peptide peptidase SppA
MASALTLLCQPMAISEDGLKLIAAIASRDGIFAEVREKARAEHDGELDNDRPGISVTADGIAIVAVNGPLVRHASMFSAISGASSYEQIGAELQMALDDSAVKAIVLDIDSPGGEVTGCGELARCIREARATKPVYAYASGTCASAAYWLASACTEVIADPSALVGSIGVRCLMVDDSKAEEMAGIKSYDIVSSQSPLKVADAAVPEDRVRVRASLDAMAAVFIADVAAGRGVTPGKVAAQYGKGDVFVGAQAVDAGLCDRLGNLASIVAELAAKKSTASIPAAVAARKGNTMARPKTNRVVAEGDAPSEDKPLESSKCKGCESAFSAEDDMYCAKCAIDEEEMEESEEARSFVESVTAILGESDKAKALGIVLGLKSKSDECDALRAEVASLNAIKVSAEIKALLDAAVTDGRVMPAKRADMEGLAAKHGVEVLKASLGVMGKAPVSAVAPAAESPKAEDKAAVSLTVEQVAAAKALGIDPAKYAAHRDNYKRGFVAAEEK